MTDSSINPSSRAVGPNGDGATTKALSKSPSDPPPVSTNPSHSDFLSSYDAASPLHFHGLAVTQTQTQLPSSTETRGEGSKTESRVAKKRKISRDHEVRLSSKPPSKDANKLSAARPGSRSASKQKRRRSPSLTSIDSFAEAEDWEDHARVFLASNPRFEVPLSELGRGTTQKESQVRHHTVNGIPLSPDPTQVVLRHSSPTKVVSADDTDAAEAQRPMVPSDGALSQVANVSIDAQERSPSPISDIPGDIPTPMMSNSSSIGYYPVDQAEDYQATQPLSPEDLDRNSTQVFDSHPRQTSPPAWGSMASRPSANPRSILSMVNPQKQWRLRRGEKLLQAALQSGSDGQTQPPANASGQSETAVVPDSEPPDASNMSSTSARPLPAPSIAIEDRVSQNDKEKDSQIEDDEEDIPLRFTLGHPAKAAPPSPSKARNPPKSKVQSLPPTPPLTGSRWRGKEREDNREDALTLGTRSDQASPAADGDSTEPADDLPMGFEDDAPAPQGPKVPPKRTHFSPLPPPKAAYRSGPRAKSNTPSMVSGGRATKNIKAHHPTATRVFALWKQDAAYFSGMVYERVEQSGRFKIHFDDGDEDDVDVKNLRQLELQIDDRISIIESQEKATISSFVSVRLIEDLSIELEVEVTGIKVHSRAIRSQWGNRIISAEEIVTLVPKTKSETPSSFRNSSASLNKKVLTKVGIVVTLSVGRDREKEKEAIMRIIRTNGGTVLDDWSEILSVAGEHSTNKKRWFITSDNIGTEMKHDVQQIFLVSDAANTKPRFLTALALGIPCLSIEWLRRLSSGQCAVSDWHSFLLPAGYSDSLEARVTQMVDLDWGTTLDHLTSILSNNVPTKLFAGKSVLVLGPQYFPPPAKGKKGASGVGDDKSSDGGRFVPRIIVCMGATRVEAAPELKYSSSPDLKNFHYVVVKDLHERPPAGGEKYVSMEWVKDCLIAGRLFPVRV
ncbi:hypothetical protein BC826DRAFT_987384 [Russula brevipes]|nr:hypothetical protein BC826DRAFT_987384 [Russula brevipes]